LKTVDGAGSGLDADSLQGFGPGHFYASGQTVANANLLDGLDSTAFMHGKTIAEAFVTAHFANAFIPIVLTTFGGVYVQCPAAGNNGLVRITVQSGTIETFFDNGGSNPTYAAVTGPADLDRAWAATGEAFTYSISTPTKLYWMQVNVINRAANCLIQVHGTDADL
jgi:hypothetical protein